MVYVPRFQRGSDVGGKQNVHGIHRYAQQHVLHGQVAQDERKGERIKRSGGQTGKHQQDQHDRQVGGKRKHQADEREQGGACQQNTPCAQQPAKIYRKGTDEHQGRIECGVDPRRLIRAQVQNASQVGQADAYQASGTSRNHCAQQDTGNAQHGMGGNHGIRRHGLSWRRAVQG